VPSQGLSGTLPGGLPPPGLEVASRCPSRILFYTDSIQIAFRVVTLILTAE
jgi:hypothetical protein